MSRIRDIASILTTASNLATDTETAAAITAHNTATTSVHGITNTADLATQTYVQLNKGVQSGTSIQRPTSFLSSNGDVYSNTTTGYLEVYSSTYGWEKVGANPSNLTVTPTNLGTARAYNDGGVELDLGFPSVPGRSYVVTSTPSSGTTTVTTPYAIITGLQSSTQYTFTATATNLYGSSTPTTSSPITVTTVPQAPTIGTATAVGSTTAYVTWTAGATGGSAITTYTVHKFSGSTLIDSTNVATSTSANISVNTGTTYTFKVSATNANGMSELSAASNSVTTSAGVPQMLGTLNISNPYNGGWVTSSGDKSLIYTVSGPNSNQSIVYLTNDTITWQKDVSVANPSYTGGATLSANGNIVVASDTSSQNYGLLNIFNSSGTNTLQKIYTTGTGTGFSSAITDSSNNIYVYGASDASQQAMMAKLDTTGAVVWAPKWSCVQYSGGFQSGALDASNNLYAAGYVHGGYQGIIAKVNSSGTPQWYANIRGNSSPTSGEGNFGGIAVSSSGDVYGGAGWSNSGGSNRKPTLLKYNTNGTLQWQREFAYGTAANTYYSGLTYDNTGNYVYGVFGNYIVKYNSSGTLQWQRKFTTASVTLNTISLNGQSLVIGGKIDNKPAIIVVPVDGSKTGSYTFGGSTVVYEAGTGTEQAGNALTTDAGLTSGSASLSVSSPGYSISDSSYALTKVNI